MKINEKYGMHPSDESLNRVSDALKANGISCIVVATGEDARAKFEEIVPEGAEIMNMTSATLDATGISGEITSGRYKSVRSMLATAPDAGKKKIGSAPEWVVGSVHAITEDGKIIIASASGSQLPAYAYGSSHVVFVVGYQKIVKDVTDGIRRIYEYTFPLEDERARRAYGVGSGVNKLLIINKEFVPTAS